MKAIRPVVSHVSQSSFNVGQKISTIGNKVVSLISNVPSSLIAVKNSAVSATSVFFATLKAFIIGTFKYISTGFVKAMSALEITFSSVASTLGPYYPIIAISVIALAIGAGSVYALREQN